MNDVDMWAVGMVIDQSKFDTTPYPHKMHEILDQTMKGIRSTATYHLWIEKVIYTML